ncbi:MAG: hypothetical protein ACTHM4_01630 [Rhodanobacteraceae bacterium]
MNGNPIQPAHASRTTAIASYIAAAVALLLVMFLHLLPALIAGLLVYAVVDALAPLLERRWPGGWARQLVVGVLAVVVAGLLALLIFAVVAFFRAELGDPNTLFDRMMPTIDRARTQLPGWIVGYLPVSAEDFRFTATQLARAHSEQLQVAGKETAHVFGRILVGLALGALVALTHTRPDGNEGPLRRDLTARCERFARAFHDIVFAQARISALNTIFTAIFLLIALPLAGVHLPFTKTLIVIVALSVSLWVALGALIFLVLIHKLEYFLNANIVGNRIHARAWEILLAMLVMEAAFGLPGIVAAPIYYAYLKSELTAAKLI